MWRATWSNARRPSVSSALNLIKKTSDTDLWIRDSLSKIHPLLVVTFYKPSSFYNLPPLGGSWHSPLWETIKLEIDIRHPHPLTDQSGGALVYLLYLVQKNSANSDPVIIPLLYYKVINIHFIIIYGIITGPIPAFLSCANYTKAMTSNVHYFRDGEKFITSFI